MVTSLISKALHIYSSINGKVDGFLSDQTYVMSQESEDVCVLYNNYWILKLKPDSFDFRFYMPGTMTEVLPFSLFREDPYFRIRLMVSPKNLIEETEHMNDFVIHQVAVLIQAYLQSYTGLANLYRILKKSHCDAQEVDFARNWLLDSIYGLDLDRFDPAKLPVAPEEMIPWLMCKVFDSKLLPAKIKARYFEDGYYRHLSENSLFHWEDGNFGFNFHQFQVQRLSPQPVFIMNPVEIFAYSLDSQVLFSASELLHLYSADISSSPTTVRKEVFEWMETGNLRPAPQMKL